MAGPDWRVVLAPHFVALDSTDKNWGAALPDTAATTRDLWHVPLGDLSTPVLTIDVDLVAHNIRSMQHWLTERGLLFAPHGKTTMTPGLWQWQLDAGAWAITVANEAQLRVARAAGIATVIVANEFLSPQGLAWLADELDADPAFDVTCWVDSVDAVERMSHALATAGASRPVGVCVELGAMSARTGARTDATARAVAEAARLSPALELRGVAGYEGSVPGSDDAETLANVRAFLARLADTALALRDLFEVPEPIATAGGSRYFDIVALELGRLTPEFRVVVRSGASVVHDDGGYRRTGPSAVRQGPQLHAAAHVWSRVISTPEPGLALLDVGKRDIPYDMDLPEVQLIVRDGVLLDVTAEAVASAVIVTGTNDQHAYAHFDVDAPTALRVGDVVRLGLSHPCTIFDKWRSMLLVENGASESTASLPVVRGAIRTFF